MKPKEPQKYHILYEQDGIIVVDKSAGLPTQPTRSKEENLYDLLLERYSYVGLHHRLDQATSGLVLCTTHQKNNRSIAQQIRERKIQRLYTCVVLGTFLERGNAGQWTTDIDGKEARTDWRCLKKNNSSALLEVTLHTGRKHQIRKHANTHQSPILGDRRYGHAGTLAKRLCLHAHQLSFVHPQSREHISITSPIPTLMQRYVDRIL